MRLTVFGATGRTGRHLIEQALAAGHELTILVRDPSKVKIQHVNLKILAGNVQNPSQVEQAIAGSEAVLSVLGPTENKPTYEISNGTDNILSAMAKQGVRRLILSTGAGVRDPNDVPGPFYHLLNFLVKVFSRYVYEEMVRVVARVRTSDLDWTVLRVPMLTDDPGTGKLRVGYVGKGVGSRIRKADAADFMLRQLTENTFLRKAPAISN